MKIFTTFVRFFDLLNTDTTMDTLQAIILGIVQGLTEFLPVSSSGHLAITQHILGVSGESNLFFDVMLHIGTLAAVIVFYHKLIGSLIVEFFRMLKENAERKTQYQQMINHLSTNVVNGIADINDRFVDMMCRLDNQPS